MTFLDNNILTLMSNDSMKGFKCIENHNSEKAHKYRYYCVDCKKNICSKCIMPHLGDEEKRHNLIVIDYQKIIDYKEAEEINNKRNDEIKKFEDKSDSNNS